MADLVDLVVIGYPDETTAEKAYEVVSSSSSTTWSFRSPERPVVVKHGDGRAQVVTKTGATRAGRRSHRQLAN